MSTWKKIFSTVAVLAVTVAVGVTCSYENREIITVAAVPAVQDTKVIAEKSQNITVEGTRDAGKVLVAYYTNNDDTGTIARQIADIMGGDVAKIERANPYPADFQQIAKEEIEGENKPAITLDVENVSDYNTIFVGYPIWYDNAPAMVATFLSNSDFTGKTLIPFTLSPDATVDNSVHIFKELCPEATMEAGLTARSGDDVRPWLEQLGYLRGSQPTLEETVQQ